MIVGYGVVDLEGHEVARRTAVWCDTCLLPSIIEVDVNVVAIATLAVWARFTVSCCQDCGAIANRKR